MSNPSLQSLKDLVNHPSSPNRRLLIQTQKINICPGEDWLENDLYQICLFMKGGPRTTLPLIQVEERTIPDACRETIKRLSAIKTCLSHNIENHPDLCFTFSSLSEQTKLFLINLSEVNRLGWTEKEMYELFGEQEICHHHIITTYREEESPQSTGNQIRTGKLK